MKFLFDFFPAAAFLIAMFIPENREEGIYLATKVIIVTSFLQIIVSWITSPVLGGVLAFLMIHLIRITIFDHEAPFERAKVVAPFFIAAVVFNMALVTLFKGLKNFHLDFELPEALARRRVQCCGCSR